MTWFCIKFARELCPSFQQQLSYCNHWLIIFLNSELWVNGIIQRRKAGTNPRIKFGWALHVSFSILPCTAPSIWTEACFKNFLKEKKRQQSYICFCLYNCFAFAMKLANKNCEEAYTPLDQSLKEGVGEEWWNLFQSDHWCRFGNILRC